MSVFMVSYELNLKFGFFYFEMLGWMSRDLADGMEGTYRISRQDCSSSSSSNSDVDTDCDIDYLDDEAADNG